MKLAIDSYCYHRYFGEVYPGLQQAPRRPMTVWDFLNRAQKHGVAGVSLEACFLPVTNDAFLGRLRDTLDEMHFERVWAWGHPDGLCSGTNGAALQDLIHNLTYAQLIGAKVMRIVGGSHQTRPDKWPAHKRQLVKMLRKTIGPAQDHGIVLAIENHIDLLADEMVDLLTTIDSPWLGVCLDTANNLRLFEDTLKVAKALAPYARATHVKDLTALGGDPKQFTFWPSVPLGEGLVNVAGVIEVLKKAKYKGLLAIEVDYLHPKYGEEDRAVGRSVKYLRSLVG